MSNQNGMKKQSLKENQWMHVRNIFNVHQHKAEWPPTKSGTFHPDTKEHPIGWGMYSKIDQVGWQKGNPSWWPWIADTIQNLMATIKAPRVEPVNEMLQGDKATLRMHLL
ncbi:Uncharacterized protein Fot_53070 [Forsythia ovata]|uniref:Uncharacterized protein n=1 Tax=Forsythia ovata TaxID=205694 RepID=A0ABD1PHL6_9LAMI